MKPATGIVSTLLLVATALYLHSGDAGDDSTSAPTSLGASVARGPGGSRKEPTAHVEKRLGQAEGAPAEPPQPQDVKADRRTVDAVYQAASALALATNSPNMTRASIGDLVEALGTEVSAARGRAETPTEVRMVDLYADALVAYRDGLQFWDLRRFADRPGQSELLDALAAKYGIEPTKKISYTATWQSYPDAFPKIWAVGNAATTKGSALYNR